HHFSSRIPPTPRPPLFPYTTLFRSEIGKSEATLAYQAKEVPPEGYFIPPTIFTGVKPNMRIAREEFFGPVLSVIKVRDLDKAFRSEEHTSELQSRSDLVCRLLLEKK